MNITNFKVENREITQLNNTKLIGMVGQDKFAVDFVDDAWEGLHKTLKLIRSDGNVVYLVMDNDEVELTQECYVEGTAQLGFFGTINENEPESMKIASTDYISIYFSHHAYSTDSGEPINIPTPTQWDIIIGQMNEVKDEISEMQEDVTNKVDGFDEHVADKEEEINQIIDDFKDYVETVDYNYNNLKNKPQTWNALLGIVE